MQKRLLIIDGHAYAYRAFYAIRQLSSPSGQPTNAIYGFVRMLGKMQAFVGATHIMVVWDGGLAEARMQLLPQYKMHRPPMPESLEHQLGQIGRFLTAARIQAYHQEGVEADDWIATLARTAAGDDFSVVIASSDKDFLQLVDPRIGLLNPNDKEPRIWTEMEVVAKTGVLPKQIVDWLALLGDDVDNIPGVPGVGAMTATKLLKEFGTVGNLYTQIERVTSKRLRETLLASREQVERNLALVRLKDDLVNVYCCDHLLCQAPNYPELKELYTEWGFNTLAAEAEERTRVQQGTLL